MKEVARRYLNRDRAHYSGMLHALDDDDSQLVWAGVDGVMLRFGRLDYLSATSENAIRAMLPQIGRRNVVALDPTFDGPLDGLGFRRRLLCHSCLYEKPTPVALPPMPAHMEMRRLTHDYNEFILEHYGHADSLDYVRTRMDNGMFGLFVHGALVGFVGIHNSGEIGVLEVLPDFRRRGYGLILEAYLINKRLKAGILPFCAVETHNRASLALQRKLGMTVSERTSGWFIR